MSTNNIPNKTTARALNQKAAQGIDKYFAKVGSLTIGGVAYTPDSLKAVLLAEVDASEAVDTTRAQLHQQVATHRTEAAKARSVRGSLRTYILGAYGPAAVQMLGDFGMSAPKRASKTVQAKAEAVAKGKATREARHTMGSKQEESVHGAPEQPATTTATPSAQGTAPAATPAPSTTPPKS
jgi:hypothetical protein